MVLTRRRPFPRPGGREMFVSTVPLRPVRNLTLLEIIRRRGNDERQNLLPSAQGAAADAPKRCESGARQQWGELNVEHPNRSDADAGRGGGLAQLHQGGAVARRDPAG